MKKIIDAKIFGHAPKKETVLRLMTSLTVTVVAAATIVVVQAQVQPLVRFNSVSAIGTNIVYDAEILDIDNTIDDSSLFSIH